MQSKDASLGMVYVRGGARHCENGLLRENGLLSANWASLWRSSLKASTADYMCVFSSSMVEFMTTSDAKKYSIRPLSVLLTVLETSDIPLFFPVST